MLFPQIASPALSIGPCRPEPWKKQDFSFEDGTVVLKVESKYFKVHRYFLKRDSEVFEGMFSVPLGEGSSEGTTEETAIVIPDVSVHEMECLLTFLYYGMYNSDVQEKDDLVALLSISTRFIFKEIREIVIAKIDRFDSSHSLINPVEKVEIALKFDVPRWLRPAYIQICLRADPLTIEEVNRLGLETAMSLVAAREKALLEERKFSCSRGNNYYGCPCCNRERVQIADSHATSTMRDRVGGIVDEFELPGAPRCHEAISIG